MNNYFLSLKEINKIEKHYKKYFTMEGAIDSKTILHEITSDDMHIDIVVYNPSEKFRYNIIATIGMSGYNMVNAPYKNIELITLLPKDWKLDNESLKDIQWYWPIKLMKSAARLPYTSNSILSVGHTFSMDVNNTPLAPTTEMCSGLIAFPTWFNHGIFSLNVGNLFYKKTVNFLCLTAINEKELNLIIEKGPQYFLEECLVNTDKSDDLLVRNKR